MKIPDYKISVIRLLLKDALCIANRAKQRENNEGYIDSLIEALKDILEAVNEMDE